MIKLCEPLTVLSLCDGMSCGHIALDRIGVPVKAYYAAEIKPHAIKVTCENYPNTVQIGDVTKISYVDGVLHTEKGDFTVGNIDLVMFGSPCQTVSGAMRTEKRVGLLDPKKSGLFYECYRILEEVKPKWYLMENVSGMRDADREIISETLGNTPIYIDSAVVAPAMRKRYYWTNIPGACAPTTENSPTLQSVLTDGYVPNNKAYCLLVSHSRPNRTPVKLFYRSYVRKFINCVYKDKEHYEACTAYYNEHYKGLSAADIPMDDPNASIFAGVRVLNRTELERCQTVPEGYTDCLSWQEAADVLGDGWTVDVIAHLMRGLLTV